MCVTENDFVGVAELSAAVGRTDRAIQRAVLAGDLTPDGEVKSGNRRFSLWRKERVEATRALMTVAQDVAL